MVAAAASCLRSLPATVTFSSLGGLALLLPSATRPSTCFAAGGARATRVLLLLLARQPLLLCEHKFAADGRGLVRRIVVEVVHRLQPPDDFLDGEVLEVEQGLDGDLELRVLPRRSTKKLLHRSLLVHVPLAVEDHLLLQRGEAESEVLDVLPWVEGEVLPLLA